MAKRWEGTTMKNPITELTGPEFLVFYAILIVATVAFCWWRRQSCDSSASLPPASLPDRPEPYEIEFMRGCETEVARVAIVRLMELGYLEIANKKEYKWGGWYETTEKRIVKKSDQPKLNELTALERCVFQWCEFGRKIEDVFADGELSALLRSHTVPYEEKLQADHLLASDQMKAQGSMTAFVGAAVLGLIGGSRVFVGLSRERPVGSLIMMGVAGLSLAINFSRPDRLSRSGKTFLKGLQEKWNSFEVPLSLSASDGAFVLAAALFGVSVLAVTR